MAWASAAVDGSMPDEPDLMAELLASRDNQKELEDRFTRTLAFGTGHARGAGRGRNRMNVFTVRRAAAGLADYLNSDPDSRGKCVAIGFDSRKYSDRFAKQTALVLAARGVRACLFDSLRPVPMLSFAVRRLGAAAGVVITASHNPPEYNGFKAYGPDGAQLSPEAADSVTEAIRALSFEEALPMDEQEALRTGMLTIICEEIDSAYNDMVLGLMVCPDIVREVGSQLRIVYTPLHGSGNLPVRRALRDAGITHVKVVPEQELPDPAFSTVRAPNPEDPAAFDMAIPLARQAGATVILGTDPDCDRLGVCAMDSQGSFRTLSGNQIGCLLLHHILSARKAAGTLPENGAAVKSIVSTNLANAICEDYGVTLYEVLTGFKYIGEKIQQFEDSGEHIFLFGFEESYGYLSGTEVRDKDAVNAAVLVAEAACVCLKEASRCLTGADLCALRLLDDDLVGHLSGQGGRGAIKSIMARLHDETPGDIDGVKVLAKRDYLKGVETSKQGSAPLLFPPSDVVYFKLDRQFWTCVRPSGTEPKIKFYAGASHPGSLQDAKEACAQLLEAFKQLAK